MAVIPCTVKSGTLATAGDHAIAVARHLGQRLPTSRTSGSRRSKHQNAAIEPMAYRFLLSFAKDNELQTRDGRIAERSKLAEMQRVGDTA